MKNTLTVQNQDIFFLNITYLTSSKMGSRQNTKRCFFIGVKIRSHETNFRGCTLNVPLENIGALF